MHMVIKKFYVILPSLQERDKELQDMTGRGAAR
jgi:hypothetical protein